MKWLRRKILKWLKVDLDHLESRYQRLDSLYKDLVNIGVDVHFKSPHMILIYSSLNGGQIKEVQADFKNLKELRSFVQELKFRFNTRVDCWDKPPGYSSWILLGND
jgi:hypothetical protein